MEGKLDIIIYSVHFIVCFIVQQFDGFITLMKYVYRLEMITRIPYQEYLIQPARKIVQINVQTNGNITIMDGMLTTPSKFHVVSYSDMI